MNRIVFKLNRQRGASVVFALIIFLLCALAGVSSFIMAAANAGRFSHTDDQEYYSVSSAALLVVDLLDDFTYTSPLYEYKYQHEWTSENGTKRDFVDGYSLTQSTRSNIKGGSDSFRTGFSICTKIQAQCDSLVPFLDIPNEWYETANDNPVKGTVSLTKPENVPSLHYKFAIDITDRNNKVKDERFGKVNCELIMNQNYDLIFTFKGEKGQYVLSVYWVAESNPINNPNKPVYEYSEGDFQNGKHIITNTLQVSVEWNKENVTISRGEAQGLANQIEGGN